jgi:lysozyme
MPTINSDGLALIKSFEGCVLHAYPDPGTGGEPYTIGYGHTGSDVHPGLTWTQAQADAGLLADLGRFERDVSALVSRSVTPNQFAALVSFDYNTGSLSGSTLLRKLNAGDIAGAAAEFGKWVNGGNPPRPMPGLVRRRGAERALFLKA